MVHNLKERLVFFCDVGVENAHQTINSTTKEMIGPPVMELEICNVVVIFCIHPSFLVLAAIPDICQAIYKMVRSLGVGIVRWRFTTNSDTYHTLTMAC
jgi:hypothetical protein